jgi:hypothetical protein
MPVCPLCHSRKGKRACPALRTSICSACCGEKRIVEIACPSDCVYLAQGTQNDFRREAADYLQHQDPRRSLRWLKALESLGFLLEAIERMIAAAPFRSLEDAELRQALQSARKTFESEAKGIIYEDLPTSPTLQALTRDLVSGVRAFKSLVEKQRDEAGPRSRAAFPDWGPDETAQCFAVLEERCEYHEKRKEEAGSFVAYLRRVHPPDGSEGTDSTSPRIVLA